MDTLLLLFPMSVRRWQYSRRSLSKVYVYVPPCIFILVPLPLPALPFPAFAFELVTLDLPSPMSSWATHARRPSIDLH